MVRHVINLVVAVGLCALGLLSIMQHDWLVSKVQAVACEGTPPASKTSCGCCTNCGCWYCNG